MIYNKISIDINERYYNRNKSKDLSKIYAKKKEYFNNLKNNHKGKILVTY